MRLRGMVSMLAFGCAAALGGCGDGGGEASADDTVTTAPSTTSTTVPLEPVDLEGAKTAFMASIRGSELLDYVVAWTEEPDGVSIETTFVRDLNASSTASRWCGVLEPWMASEGADHGVGALTVTSIDGDPIAVATLDGECTRW